MKKKLVSVIISLIAAFALMVSLAMPALAAITVYSPAGVYYYTIPDPLLNEEDSNQVSGSASGNADDGTLTFTYTGDDEFDRWTLIDSDGNIYEIEEDSEYYEIVSISDDGTVVTIKVLDWEYFEDNGITGNAITVESEETTEAEEEEEETTVASSDTSSTSPSTGGVSAVAVAAVAAVGAGAVIVAMKKKSEEE